MDIAQLMVFVSVLKADRWSTASIISYVVQNLYLFGVFFVTVVFICLRSSLDQVWVLNNLRAPRLNQYQRLQSSALHEGQLTTELLLRSS